MNYSVSITEKDYHKLRNHMFSGDNLESGAIALCGVCEGNKTTKLLVHEVALIPYDVCSIRQPDLLSWPTEYIIPYLQKANKHGFSIIKFHSHPSGLRRHSCQDELSDNDLFPSIYGWVDGASVHASCIMLPNFEFVGRVYDDKMNTTTIDKFICIGGTIKDVGLKEYSYDETSLDLRNRQAFGEGTLNTLKNLKIAVVGCSGTGSITIEQLVRLGVGELLIVDPDIVEEKNLNRILNTTLEDAICSKKKVDVLKKQLDKVGFNTKITALSVDIFDDISIIKEIAQCDVIFGCLDCIEGRHLLNQISSFYIIPYFDMGVYLEADGNGGVNYINGSIHYIQPNGSSLLTRSVYSGDELRSALMLKFNPDLYNEMKKEKYIKNVNVDSPAVISVNMQISSAAINEFLARIHGFRENEIENFAIMRIDILEGYTQIEDDGLTDEYLKKYVGRGDNIIPFLNMPEFSVIEN